MKLSDHGRAMAVLGLVLVAAGLLVQRVDVAVIGLPLLVAAAWGLADARREVGPVAVVPVPSDEGGHIVGAIRFGHTDLARVRVTAPGHRSLEMLVAGAQDGLEASYTSLRTGPQDSFVVQVAGCDADGVRYTDADVAQAPRWLSLPRALPLGAVPVPRQLRGVAGSRTAPRLGDGAELWDIDAVTGPARRIDWRTTARRSPDLSQLYARRTRADGEAVAVLVVDSRDDLGPDLSTWTGYAPARVDEATSLDLARHAAASVATALIDAGDRVGLTDLGTLQHTMPPAAGRRHLRRLIHGLALTAPIGEARRVRAPAIPSGGIVYLFSTLLDDDPLRLVRAWLEGRHVVVVVDTLPQVRVPTMLAERLAWDIARMERDDRIAALRAHGVPVIAWTGRDRAGAVRALQAWAVQLARRGGRIGGAR